MAETTLSTLVTEVSQVLAPLPQVLASPSHVRQFLAALGWELPPLINDIGFAGTAIDDLLTATLVLVRSTDAEWDNEVVIAERVAKVILEIRKVIKAITTAMDALATNTALPANYLTATHMDTELVQRLLDFLFVTYLERHHYLLYQLLKLAGIVQVLPVLADPTIYQTAHVRRKLNFDVFGALLSPNRSWAREVYGWGTPDANISTLMANFGNALVALGASPISSKLSRPLEEAIAGHSVPEADTTPMPALALTLLQGIAPDRYRIGLMLVELRPSVSAAPDAGLGVLPFVFGTAEAKFPLPTASGRWEIVLDTTVDVTGGVVLSWRPNTGVQVQTGLFGGGAAPLASGNVALHLQYTVPTTDTAALFMFPGGTSFGLQGFKVGGGAQFTANSTIDAFSEAHFEGGKLTISLGGADGFLQKILPPDGIEINFDFSLGWSNTKGLYFRGGAGLEATLPVNIDLLGILKIPSVYLSLQAKDVNNVGGIEAIAATTVIIKLGPLTATVEQFGLQATLSFPPKGGNLGVANLDIAFKPPNGVGLAIKAPVVTGGGYLYFDFEKEQYAGVLQLEIAQKFFLTAVGLLTTKMPDGSKGFSLLVIISVRFDPGIQLGYGFSLTGLGGLLGVNRTVKAEVLREGLRRGALGSILFPQNIVENAPQIISNLSAIFPPAQDRFLFGPMAIIGWGGSPPILTLELGIILELPEPVRLMILGRLRVVLPNKKEEADGEKKEQAPKLKLQLDALGIFDFGSGDISLDAVLYDSTIGPFAVTGQMALRASFGAQPMFLLSVGGFHPAFQAPAGFPSVERVAFTLAKKDGDLEVRLQMSAYFALTSNTVQLGSHVDLYVHLGIFEVIGQLGFDALIQFEPFGLIASFEAMVMVKASGQVLMGIRLQVNLTGPSPWHAWGKAELTFLFIRVTAEFDVQVGREEPPPLPPTIKVFDELMKELQNPTNWSSQLPAGENPLVTFRSDVVSSQGSTGKPPPKIVLVHPFAELQVNQRLVPLVDEKAPITRYGNTTPEGDTMFTLTAKVATGTDGTSMTVNPVSDWFAPAQFYDMPDAQKLSAPSFQQMQSGIRFKVKEGYQCGTPVSKEIRAATLLEQAETIPAAIKIQATDAPLAEPTFMATPPTVNVLRQVAGWGAAGTAAIRTTGLAKYRDLSRLEKGVTLKPAAYRVVGEQEEPGGTDKGGAPSSVLSSLLSAVTTVGQDTMAAMGAEPSLSYSAAREQLAQARGKNPNKRMWVVPDIGMKRGAG